MDILEGIISPQNIIYEEFDPPLRIGVLASGEGSNFEAIAESIQADKLKAIIKLLIVNNRDCNAISRAIRLGVPYLIIDHRHYNSREEFDRLIADKFISLDIEIIVMAGWMRIVTKELISKFPSRIINIHPSLLPSFKGLKALSQAVNSGVLIAGCSTHFVNSEVDDGQLISQAAIRVEPDQGTNVLLKRLQKFEHIILPQSISIAGSIWRASVS